MGGISPSSERKKLTGENEEKEGREYSADSAALNAKQRQTDLGTWRADKKLIKEAKNGERDKR